MQSLKNEEKCANCCALYTHIISQILNLLSERWNYKEITREEVFQGAVLFLGVASTEPETQIRGVVNIFDLDGFSLQQALLFTPSFAKMLVDLLQDVFPFRLKALHFVNQSKFFKIAFAVLKPFLKEKLRNRLYFHGKDMTSLHKHVSPDCLPKEYGGNLEIRKVTADEWCLLLNVCEEEFNAMNAFGYKNVNRSKVLGS